MFYLLPSLSLRVTDLLFRSGPSWGSTFSVPKNKQTNKSPLRSLPKIKNSLFLMTKVSDEDKSEKYLIYLVSDQSTWTVRVFTPDRRRWRSSRNMSVYMFFLMVQVKVPSSGTIYHKHLKKSWPRVFIINKIGLKFINKYKVFSIPVDT